MSASNVVKEDLVEQQIIAVAKRLFEVYGLAKVTMDDVAKAAGKGRSSLYYYYKNKDEIFDAVLTIEIREMLTAMAQAVALASGTENKLRAFFLTKIEVLRQKRAFFKMLDVGMDADAISNLKKAQLVHHNHIIRQESALLEQILADGMSKGQVRQMAAAEREIFNFVVLSGLRGVKRELEFEADTEKVLPAVELYTRMAMCSLK